MMNDSLQFIMDLKQTLNYHTHNQAFVIVLGTDERSNGNANVETKK
jgi:hypothetical protein